MINDHKYTIFGNLKMSDIRKILNTLTEMTSGSVASVAMPLQTQRRDHLPEQDTDKSGAPEVLEYGNWENSSLTTSKKLKQTRGKAKKLVKKIYGEDMASESMDGVAPSTKMFTSESKTKNPVARAAQRVAKGSGKHKNPAKVLARKAKHKKMYEEEITEQDLIISPVIKRVRDRDLISRDHSRVDREVEMARGDCRQSIQNAEKILARIQNRSEDRGLEGWVQEKIIKASDYLNTVREYLENQSSEHDEMDDMDPRLGVTEDTTPKNVPLIFKTLNLKNSQIAEYTKKYFECHNIDQPHGKFISNIKRFSKINESTETKDIAPFINMLQQVDSKKKIKIGDKFAVLEFEIIFAHKEITGRGFITPKEVEEIKLHNDGKINYIKFTDGDRYPRLTHAHYEGKPITYAAYFTNKDHAQQALSAIIMTIPDEWDLDISDIDRESLAEGTDKNVLQAALGLYRQYSKNHPHKEAVRQAAEVHNLDPVKLNNYIDRGKYSNKEQGVAEGSEDKTAQQRKSERDKQRTAPAQKARNQAQRKGLQQDKDGTYYANEGVAEGNNSSPYDEMARLKSKTNKELDELVQFWQKVLEKRPDDKIANDQLHIIKMIRAERIGKKGVTEDKQEYKLNLESIEKRFGEIKLTEGLVRNNQSLLRYLAKNNVSAEVFDHIIEQKIRAVMKDKQIHSDLKPKLMGLSFNDLEKLSESAGNDYIKFHKNISKNLDLPQHKGLVSNTLNLYSVYRKQKIYESEDKSLSDIERKLFSDFNSRAKSTIDSVKQGDSVSLLMLNTLSIPDDKVFANLQGFLAPKQIKSITTSNGIDYLHFADGTRFPETDKNDPIHLAQSWSMTKLFDSYDSASKAYMTYALEGKKLSKQIEFNINVDDKQSVEEEKLVSPKHKPSKCSKCGGPSYSDEGIAEAKDACYYKVKSRYKVWPSAYASGALVKCRRVGAKNWGNKSKK